MSTLKEFFRAHWRRVVAVLVGLLGDLLLVPRGDVGERPGTHSMRRTTTRKECAS